MTESFKELIDWTAVGTAFATFFGWLPNIAAGLATIWTLIRIYEWIKAQWQHPEQ